MKGDEADREKGLLRQHMLNVFKMKRFQLIIIYYVFFIMIIVLDILFSIPFKIRMLSLIILFTFGFYLVIHYTTERPSTPTPTPTSSAQSAGLRRSRPAQSTSLLPPQTRRRTDKGRSPASPQTPHPVARDGLQASHGGGGGQPR